MNLEYSSIFSDVNTPMHRVPVAPGRNLAVIIETAARNYLVKLSYGASAVDFEKRINKEIRKREKKQVEKDSNDKKE